MKQPSLKLRPQSWARILTEHVLTLVIWTMWVWSASQARIDWKIVLFKAPTLPLALEAGAILSVILLAALWVRSYYSLAPFRPMPLEFELDPRAEQKCLALIGWDAEVQALARKTQCFDVSMGREDLKCQISVS